MTNETTIGPRSLHETRVMQRFLQGPGEATFTDLFRILSPQLVAFFTAQGSAFIAEDLAQEVMLTVYRTATQIRDHRSFRGWVFTIARNTLSRHYTRHAPKIETVDFSEVPDLLAAVSSGNGGAPAFEFNNWIDFLDCREKEILRLRFVEEWEYHEIAAAQKIPIGTVQSRLFNAKRKLAPILRRSASAEREPRWMEKKAA